MPTVLEEATQQLKNEKKPVKPEAHVEIDLNAFIPKTYIAADRQRMDAYRRLTRCTSVEMIGDLQRDLTDAFGEPPRAMTIMYALTELRLLASHFGIDSIVRKQPDVVLTVRDAKKAQVALAKAPGTLRVIDDKTVLLPPPGRVHRARAAVAHAAEPADEGLRRRACVGGVIAGADQQQGGQRRQRREGRRRPHHGAVAARNEPLTASRTAAVCSGDRPSGGRSCDRSSARSSTAAAAPAGSRTSFRRASSAGRNTATATAPSTATASKLATRATALLTPLPRPCGRPARCSSPSSSAG